MLEDGGEGLIDVDEKETDTVDLEPDEMDGRAQYAPPSYDEGEEWVQEYIEQFGTEPGFF